MSSVKTVLVVIVLAAIAGAVYVMVNNSPSAPPPPEAADGWATPPKVEMPELGTAQSPFAPPAGGVAVAVSPGVAGTLAPPFSPEQPAEKALAGGMAPPFSPPEGPAATPSQPRPSGSVSGSPLSPGASEAPAPGPAGEEIGEVREAFARFMDAARQELQQGKLAEVHQTLSLWYNNPQLTAQESQQLTELLDQVAGEVVYSRKHLLERPYVVKPGDTLQRIARAYGVPWQLLAKINGVQDPENLETGRELKVVRGPFDAVVNLEKHELTLMLGPLYAGRFPIGVGRTDENLEGTYFVVDKVVQADGPNNPLGKYWIKLSDRIGIHGTNDPRNIGTDDAPGTICLGDKDIEDVHDILSVGSRVQILR